MSFAQEQLWFLDQLSPEQTIYNVLMVWRLRGPLRVDLLRRGLDLVVARHESLRVTIRAEDGVPYQVVAPAADVPLPVTDLGGRPDGALRAELDAQRAEPYELASGPLCRFRLLRLGADDHVFCAGFHHIVTDGWSAAVIASELSTAYRSLVAGTEPVFADRQLDYTEYAESQRDRLRGDVLADELAFWRERLAGLPVLELPADRPRPTGGGHRGETLITDLPADLRGLVQRLADDHAASMFMVLAAAYAVVLGRYGGLDDVPTGVPMLGRPEPELEAVVGMFINMAVLRTDLSGDPSFGTLLDRVADGTLDLVEHQEVPFTQVVEAVQPVRDPDRNPLFQVSVQLLTQSTSGESLDLPGVAAEFLPLGSLESRFDISLNLIDTGSSLRASVEHSAEMFDAWRIAAMLTHLETVLRAAAADPGRRLSQLPIVPADEADRLLAAEPRAYVVDRTMNLLPRGVPGELLVGADAGIPAPFGPGFVRRTGELARWTQDLRLERLGPLADERELRARLNRASAAPGPTAAGGDLRTPTERSVAGIFGEVLSLPTVGAEDSFFDVGGNSLQAMRAVSRINKGFGIKLSVRTLYGNGTVRAVSAVVDEKVGGASA